MRVDHAQVEGRKEDVGVGKSNESSVVDNTGATSVNLTSRLVSVTLIRTSDGQRSVGQVELVGPSDESRSACGSGCNVGVVGSNCLARSIPLEADLLSREGQRLRTVARDSWTTAVASNVQVDAGLVGWDVRSGWVGGSVSDALPVRSVVRRDTVDVGLVDNVEGWEVLPGQTRGVLGTGANVGGEESPCP